MRTLRAFKSAWSAWTAQYAAQTLAIAHAREAGQISPFGVRSVCSTQDMGGALMTGWVFYVTAALAGAVLGSFLNVVIHRGPAMWKLIDGPHRGDLVAPRSSCPQCGARIRNRDLVPIVSYIMLRGRCAACGAPIPLRYPLVEIMGAAAALIALYLFGLTAAAALAFVFLLFLIALGVIDHETGYLPDALTLPLAALGLLVNIAALFAPFADALLGAAIGYGAFRLVDLAFTRLRGYEGLGQGDAKLLAAIGAWLGWAALPPVVFLAALLALAGVAAAALGGVKVGRETPVPFGPALAGAGAAAMIAHGLRLPFFA
jgi:leader peptidase (prepilin peptidase) / N-methyltransferase